MLRFSLQNRGERFIDEECQEDADPAFGKGKGQVKDQESFEQTVHGGQDCLIHSDDSLHRYHHLRIKGIGNEIIDGNTNQGSRNRTDESADDCARFRVFTGIDRTCSKRERRTDDEIGKLANAHRGCKKEMQEIFEQANRHPRPRTDRKRGQKRRKIGDIELQKTGNDRNGEFEHHQNDGERGHNGYDRHLARIGAQGFLLLHFYFFLSKMYWKKQKPHFKKWGKVFANMQNTEFLSFLIRTVTVGTGISPDQQTLADFTADVEFHQPPKSGQRPQETVFILSILTRSVFKPR